jgi:F-type H+-transporting ATPase subunit delta
MLKGAVSSRYAEALYNVAVAQKIIDQAEEEIKLVVSTIESVDELRKILEHPLITIEEKKGIVAEIFKNKISAIILNFLYLLIDNHRQFYLKDIFLAFVELVNSARKIIQAEVTSAVDLNETEKEKLSGVIQNFTGKKVEPVFKVDPTIIGGVILRIGDKVIDGSIKSKLNSLREHLVQIG